MGLGTHNKQDFNFWVITMWQRQRMVFDQYFDCAQHFLAAEHRSSQTGNHWHEDWPQLAKSIYLCGCLLSQRCFDSFSNNRGENKLSASLPLLNMNKSPTDRVLQQPQAASPHGLLLVYWPERAGGHLQHGWGQTYIHRCDPHWCTWSPDETASPLLCHYRV